MSVLRTKLFMQRLIIKNFGPIEDLDMEVKDFMLFIGPQASGKSTIAKAVYFFKSLKEDVLGYFLQSLAYDAVDSSIFSSLFLNKFWQYWGDYYSNKEGFIEFHYSENIWFKYSLTGEFGKIEASEKFRTIFSSVLNFIQKYINEQQNRNALLESQVEKIDFKNKKKFLTNEINRRVNELFDDKREVLFIPAVRTFATILSPHIGKSKFIDEADYLMTQFMQEINSIRSLFKKSLDQLADEKFRFTKEKNKEVVELSQKLIRAILKGDYTYDNKEGERLRIKENEHLSLNHTSSGQQESLWILLLIYLNILYEKNIFLVIEEPEAHLFPEAQKHIMELVALLFNTTDSQVMITTHSPYILSSLNNLLYAGKLGKTKNGKVNALIDSKLWIDVDRTDAMYVHRPGTPPESIMDREQAMIKVERLDEISEVINAEFDKLMDIEFE